MGLPREHQRFTIPGIILLVAILVTAGTIYDMGDPQIDQASAQTELPRVGTYENLLSLLEKYRGSNVALFGARNAGITKIDTESTVAQAPAPAGAAPQIDYSETNLQVEGVDEADIVKTDGSYIYQVNEQRICIIKAQPVSEMELTAVIPFENTGFRPVELYLDEGKLIVIGTSVREALPKEVPLIMERTEKLIYPPIRTLQSTIAIIYDISDKSQVTKTRELELEGSYLSSRKVDSSFYLLTNQHLDYYYIQPQQDITPRWRDSVRGEEFVTEKLEDIRYFPDGVTPNYLMVAVIDLNQPVATAAINTYLGSGEAVYASPHNLYVAVQQYDTFMRSMSATDTVNRPLERNTTIYKFQLHPGQVSYVGSGQVPGRILNQFSMDENDGYFRIATTSGDMWRDDQYTSSNNVYVLTDDLNICGQLENIAPGERIYSTRFMGDRAYMVTFKEVDPFFVLDLKEPAHPAILGKLKLPGYSDYLHPYDENHVIGFGKDTVEMTGWNDQSLAFYQGMKVAVFEVTDVNNPVEMSKVLIGDRGTDSELLHNHKALLFSREKNLLAFPVTLMEIEGTSSSAKRVPGYGSFSFQGLYVYSLDLVNGLQYRGRITHLSEQDYLQAGSAWYSSAKNINRGIYSGDKIYTVSSVMVKAHDLADLRELNAVSLSQP